MNLKFWKNWKAPWNKADSKPVIPTNLPFKKSSAWKCGSQLDLSAVFEQALGDGTKLALKPAYPVTFDSEAEFAELKAENRKLQNQYAKANDNPNAKGKIAPFYRKLNLYSLKTKNNEVKEFCDATMAFWEGLLPETFVRKTDLNDPAFADLLRICDLKTQHSEALSYLLAEGNLSGEWRIAVVSCRANTDAEKQAMLNDSKNDKKPSKGGYVLVYDPLTEEQVEQVFAAWEQSAQEKGLQKFTPA